MSKKNRKEEAKNDEKLIGKEPDVTEEAEAFTAEDTEEEVSIFVEITETEKRIKTIGKEGTGK